MVLEAQRNGIAVGWLEPKGGQVTSLAADAAPGRRAEPLFTVLRLARKSGTWNFAHVGCRNGIETAGARLTRLWIVGIGEGERIR